MLTTRLIESSPIRVTVADGVFDREESSLLDQLSLIADFKTQSDSEHHTPKLIADFDPDDFKLTKWWDSVSEVLHKTKIAATRINRCYCCASAFGDRPSRATTNCPQNTAVIVVFLNEDWGSNDGGYFIIDEAREPEHVIFPRCGRVVIFEAGTIFHEVSPSRHSKKLIKKLFIEVGI